MSRAAWLRDLLQSGELHRVASQCRSQAELARKLGRSPDAFTSARIRLKTEGVQVPAFDELRFPATASPANQQVATDIGKPDIRQASKWPSLSEFDASTFRNEDAVQAAQAPYEPPTTASLKKLTRDEVPDGALILWASDIHIPIHDEPSCRLMVECAERSGVSRVVAGGDILDMNCLSKHAKESARTVEHATIMEEVEPGRWLLNWMATKKTDFLLGNHEDRLKRFVDENPAFHGSVASNFARVVDMPAGINVLDGEVRLGNLSLFHGHHEFKNGSGGKYPAQRLLDMFPDQSSGAGHVHRTSVACRTTRDEDGIRRTRRAFTFGHMSLEHMHYGYVSRSPNWQTGFALIRVYWEGDRPRWTVYTIEVLFDRYNRPYFEFGGVVYR